MAPKNRTWFFDPYGSSFAKASCDAKLHGIAFGMGIIYTAKSMVHLKIADSVRATVRFPRNMANAPRNTDQIRRYFDYVMYCTQIYRASTGGAYPTPFN
jgi:hypothetical protein